MSLIEADAKPQTPFDEEVAATQRYIDSPRFDGIVRLYTARQVAEQRGTIASDYTVARDAAAAFYDAPARALRCAEEHHHVRPLLAGPGRDHQAHGHRGHLPRRLGNVGEGLASARIRAPTSPATR